MPSQIAFDRRGFSYNVRLVSLKKLLVLRWRNFYSSLRATDFVVLRENPASEFFQNDSQHRERVNVFAWYFERVKREFFSLVIRNEMMRGMRTRVV